MEGVEKLMVVAIHDLGLLSEFEFKLKFANIKHSKWFWIIIQTLLFWSPLKVQLSILYIDFNKGFNWILGFLNMYIYNFFLKTHQTIIDLGRCLNFLNAQKKNQSHKVWPTNPFCLESQGFSPQIIYGFSYHKLKAIGHQIKLSS